MGGGILRRDFLKLTVAAGALVLGFRFLSQRSSSYSSESDGINAWLSIDSMGIVTVMIPKSEVGQGTSSAIPKIIAEELEVAWKDVRFSLVSPNPETTKILFASTSGSFTVREGYEGLRKVGAAAREMLLASAASEWGVHPSTCRAEKGEVIHVESGRRLAYGKLAEKAAKLAPPENPTLKNPADYKLIGKSLPRLDLVPKCNGTALYGIDASLPGMLMAAIRLAPFANMKVLNLEQLNSAAPKGVEFHPIPGGVAAVSKTFWPAFAALRDAELKFTEVPGSKIDSSFVSNALRSGLEKEAKVVFEQGEPPVLSGPQVKTISALYEVPYLAHATMEPLTCLADVRAGKCDLWLASKSPNFHQQVVADELGISRGKVEVHPLFAGGSFGRRGETEFVIQAVRLSQSLGKPVKVIWSREEDIQHDTYRPAFAARMSGVLEQGTLKSWVAVNAGQGLSHLGQRKDKTPFDRSSILSFSLPQYEIPYRRISTLNLELPVPVGFWRSTGASQNTFFVESFMDELAAAAGTDPLLFRARLLAKNGRELAVLNAAADSAGWGKKLPRGDALGIAFTEIADTLVAQVARVSLRSGSLKVREMHCAFDCGPVIDPDSAAAQIEGGIVFGLSAALYGKITFEGGKVQQSNFHDYPLLRLHESPRISVIRVTSNATIGGLGELGVPCVAPAVCNAIFSLTGKRIRKLPISDIDLSG